MSIEGPRQPTLAGSELALASATDAPLAKVDPVTAITAAYRAPMRLRTTFSDIEAIDSNRWAEGKATAYLTIARNLAGVGQNPTRDQNLGRALSLASVAIREVQKKRDEGKPARDKSIDAQKDTVSFLFDALKIQAMAKHPATGRAVELVHSTILDSNFNPQEEFERERSESRGAGPNEQEITRAWAGVRLQQLNNLLDLSEFVAQHPVSQTITTESLAQEIAEIAGDKALLNGLNVEAKASVLSIVIRAQILTGNLLAAQTAGDQLEGLNISSNRHLDNSSEDGLAIKKAAGLSALAAVESELAHHGSVEQISEEGIRELEGSGNMKTIEALGYTMASSGIEDAESVGLTDPKAVEAFLKGQEAYYLDQEQQLKDKRKLIGARRAALKSE